MELLFLFEKVYFGSLVSQGLLKDNQSLELHLVVEWFFCMMMFFIVCFSNGFEDGICFYPSFIPIHSDMCMCIHVHLKASFQDSKTHQCVNTIQKGECTMFQPITYEENKWFKCYPVWKATFVSWQYVFLSSKGNEKFSYRNRD